MSKIGPAASQDKSFENVNGRTHGRTDDGRNVIAIAHPGRSGELKKQKQEAHGPRFAHLSDIATADMQMLCNIFQILSSQLMKISSFEQFLVLKKNIWA